MRQWKISMVKSAMPFHADSANYTHDDGGSDGGRCAACKFHARLPPPGMQSSLVRKEDTDELPPA